MKTFGPAISLFTATCVAMGCSGEVEIGERRISSCDLNPEIPDGAVISVSRFWSEETGEGPALKVLGDRVDALDYILRETERPSRNAQHLSVSQWLTSNQDELPDVFQTNGGSDFMQFVQHEPGSSDQLCPLDALAVEQGMDAAFFDAAIAPLYCAETLYAWPMGLHRINVLMVNSRLYEDVAQVAESENIDFPALDEIVTLSTFLEVLETTHSLGLEGPAGLPITPLSIDGSTGWPMQLLSFEGILASLSADAYRATWSGRPGGEQDDELRPIYEELVETVARISATGNLKEELEWTDAVAQVAAGDALFTMMGDWASTLISEDQQAEIDIIPFPGSDGTIVYTVDSFAVPHQWDTDGAAAHAWLTRVALHERTQLEFAQAKHSIPPVRGLSDETLQELGPPHIARHYQQFSRCDESAQQCEMLLAVSGLGPAAAVDPCFEEIGLRLSHLAGHPVWDRLEGERRCETPVPKNKAEAREQVIEKLLEISRTEYAAACRRDP